MEEEVGLIIKPDQLIFLQNGRNEAFKHLIMVFGVKFDGSLKALKFNDGEITEVKWIDLKVAWQEKIENPEKWGGGCPPEAQEKIKELLGKHLIP